MSKLRDEIARAVARAVDRALDGERAMTPPPLGDWHPLVTDAVDDILATVRGALLSDEAVRTGGDAIWRELSDDADPSIYVAERTITAALDAVIGKGGER